MRSQHLLSLFLLTAFACASAPTTAQASGANVNVSINGYLPAPPGVTVYLDAGRPYYMEHDHRVYIARDRHHHKKKHHARHNEYEYEHERGHGYDHERHAGRGH